MGARDTSDDVSLTALRWRCRRGTRELDLLLTRCLERHVEHGDQAQRRAFARILAAEDDQLWDWICGRNLPGDPDECALIRAMRSGNTPLADDRPGEGNGH